MRSLIFADIHANLAALEAVLEAEDWDEVLFLGDAVVGGPQPDEALSVMRELPGQFVMGNHDRQVLEESLAPGETNPDQLYIQWTREQLSPANREFLETFSPPLSVGRNGRRMRLFHGDVSGELGWRVWPDSEPGVFEALAQRFPEPYVLLGHSHIQFRVQHGGTEFINPGGTGQPRLRRLVACYALLDNGGLQLKAVPYDFGATARAMDRVPLADWYVDIWREIYLRGELSDRYALREWKSLRQAGYR
jgi:predicted phosphodiesterase